MRFQSLLLQLLHAAPLLEGRDHVRRGSVLLVGRTSNRRPPTAPLRRSPLHGLAKPGYQMPSAAAIRVSMMERHPRFI